MANVRCSGFYIKTSSGNLDMECISGIIFHLFVFVFNETNTWNTWKVLYSISVRGVVSKLSDVISVRNLFDNCNIFPLHIYMYIYIYIILEKMKINSFLVIIVWKGKFLLSFSISLSLSLSIYIYIYIVCVCVCICVCLCLCVSLSVFVCVSVWFLIEIKIISFLVIIV